MPVVVVGRGCVVDEIDESHNLGDAVLHELLVGGKDTRIDDANPDSLAGNPQIALDTVDAESRPRDVELTGRERVLLDARDAGARSEGARLPRRHPRRKTGYVPEAVLDFERTDGALRRIFVSVVLIGHDNVDRIARLKADQLLPQPVRQIIVVAIRNARSEHGRIGRRRLGRFFGGRGGPRREKHGNPQQKGEWNESSNHCRGPPPRRHCVSKISPHFRRHLGTPRPDKSQCPCFFGKIP